MGTVVNSFFQLANLFLALAGFAVLASALALMIIVLFKLNKVLDVWLARNKTGKADSKPDDR